MLPTCPFNPHGPASPPVATRARASGCGFPCGHVCGLAAFLPGEPVPELRRRQLAHILPLAEVVHVLAAVIAGPGFRLRDPGVEVVRGLLDGRRRRLGQMGGGPVEQAEELPEMGERGAPGAVVPGQGAVVLRRRRCGDVLRTGFGKGEPFGQHRGQCGAGVGCRHRSSFSDGERVPVSRVSCAGACARAGARIAAARFARLIVRARQKAHPSRRLLTGFQKVAPPGRATPGTRLRMPLPWGPSYHNPPDVKPKS